MADQQQWGIVKNGRVLCDATGMAYLYGRKVDAVADMKLLLEDNDGLKPVSVKRVDLFIRIGR